METLEGSLRLAILADVHGNLPALEAVLADACAQGVDGFVVAGDLLVGGPFPVETLDRLRTLDAWSIRGRGPNLLGRFEHEQFYLTTRTAAR